MVTTLNTALRFELVGQEALVHDPAGGLVVRLTGDEHSVIVRLTNGEQIVDPTEGEQSAIDRLVEAGIVLQDDSSSSKFSRRRVMQLSAAGVAAAGLTYLVLPGAAAAASTPSPSTVPPPSPPPQPTSGTPNINDAFVTFFNNLANGGNVRAGWDQGTASAFQFTWEVFSPANSSNRVAAGTQNADGNSYLIFTRSPGQSVTVVLTATNSSGQPVAATGYTLA